jgi:myo-inositol 2-dehydrogenase / D-chiro-inositol 1-dehydrogenase
MKDKPVSRRNFVGSAAAFSIVAPQAVRGSQANSSVSVGLIGAGGRGTYDAKIVTRLPGARVTALCDLFDDRLDKSATELKLISPKIFKDYEKLLASADIDAVIIATPPFQHPPQLEAAVDAKKHIYCEKPMGVDVEGCRRVIKAGRRHDPKKNLFVGFQQRYSPEYREGHRRLTSGEIGMLANARGYWISGDPFTRVPYPDPKIEKLRNWFCYRDYSGDFIVEQDCHNFDVLHWYLNAPPISVTGMGGRKVRTNMEILDHLSLTFEFPEGIHVNFEANQISPPGFSRVGEEFTGTKGVLLTSRGGLTHIKGRGPDETERIASKGDITDEAFRLFIEHIQTGKVENVAERSAISTLFAILGRTAIYDKRQVTWKGEFGNV